ncbi:dehydrogenase with different specificitie [Pseudovirgaria hyperparasitica]|uniref:Dehydrogenase with different specificitie n=1 Tax=Pseudovirgaria hyperparasitica TaxID=470096 RepID=A0A6A6VR51_9PEZI|nr:dehydrogenase with different specificitie [Pseudovirgaria hyperparasitica]KAF2753072.1 dehydrogenase with different specificitie [Pseudovirgaria hyperparasitica]
MATAFNPKTDIPDLTGKVIFITGGTAGLGAEATYQLAVHNPARIYISGRNAKRAAVVIKKVEELGSKSTVHFIELDQGKVSSVKAATERFVAQESQLDILIANGGIMAVPAGLSSDGYEVQFGVNHMGHAMLVKHLLPLLQRTAEKPGSDVRIIFLTSLGFQFARKGIAYDTLKTTQDAAVLGLWIRYGQSKLANIWYARELAKRYPSITSISVHPGVTKTDLVGQLSLANRLFVYATNIGSMVEPHEGAYNMCWAVGVDKAKLQNGHMYEPVGKATKRLDAKPFNDDEAAEKLWTWTERELGAS